MRQAAPPESVRYNSHSMTRQKTLMRPSAKASRNVVQILDESEATYWNIDLPDLKAPKRALSKRARVGCRSRVSACCREALVITFYSTDGMLGPRRRLGLARGKRHAPDAGSAPGQANTRKTARSGRKGARPRADARARGPDASRGRAWRAASAARGRAPSVDGGGSHGTGSFRQPSRPRTRPCPIAPHNWR